jgi:hypothetical protein
MRAWCAVGRSCYDGCMASLVCATCRKLIPPGTPAVRCTVASCNTGRMKLRFCSIPCWEKHVPTARHRKPAYVIEDRPEPAEDPPR